ncbi:MAG: glycosyltransferase family 1 protein [Candidatus Moraniibacteriota bacterium]
MRIGIDARFYGSVGKGLGRYVQKLIENLEKIDKENQYFIFLLEENFNEFRPKNKNFKKVVANYRWYTLSEQINIPKLLKRYNLDLVHFPHFNVPFFYRKKFVITIHDLILLNFPTIKGTKLNPLFYWFKFLGYKFIIGSAIRRAEKIITVSNFSKKDILKNYPKISSKKVMVAYEACDRVSGETLRDSEEILNKYGIIKPYLLYVGNAYPHKNLEKLADAWKLILAKNQKDNLLERDPILVLVGKRDYFYDKLADYILKLKVKNINLVGFVSDDDLGVIYKNSSAYVFPSLYEGFGLPPLEAMSWKTPVISSNHGCMREILRDGAYYFDGTNADSIAQAILTVLKNDDLKKDLVKAGEKIILKYSWQRMAKKTLGVYQKCQF